MSKYATIVCFARKYDFSFLIARKLRKLLSSKTKGEKELRVRVFNQRGERWQFSLCTNSPRFPSAGAPIPSLKPLIKIINSTFNLCGVAILILQFILNLFFFLNFVLLFTSFRDDFFFWRKARTLRSLIKCLEYHWFALFF